MSGASLWRGGRAPVSAVVALALSCALAGVVAGGLAIWLVQRGAGAPSALAAGAGAALAAGLAAALPLLARLAELDRALAELARGEAIAVPAQAWPLEPLLDRVAAVSARVEDALERERLAGAYREELTRQIGEAAAREERNRLARELHDSIKQQLFSIDVSAAAARARAGAGGALGALDDIQRGARAAQAEMTALLQQLRPAPLENVGLARALRDQGEALGYRTGAEVSVTVGELPAEERLPPRAREELFRMAQEALANVARHARAKHVWLRLERQGAEILLEVRDDGLGFDVASAPPGMGLANLRERARALGGVAEIESAPGQGTVARIRLPLAEPPRALSPEEVARQAALEAAVERGDWWQAWSLNLLRVAFLIILLGLPFWAAAVGFALAGWVYTRGWLAWREVTRLAGGARELALRSRDHELGAWLLIGLALCAWYLPVSAPRGWSPGVSLGLAIGGSAALLGMGLWSWEMWRRVTGRYYRILPMPQRRLAIERRWQECAGMWVAIAIIIALGLLFGRWAPALPPRTDVQWSDAASIALIVTLVTLNGLETWLTWRWRRALSGVDDQEARG